MNVKMNAGFAATSIIIMLARAAAICFICWLVSIHDPSWLVIMGILGMISLGGSISSHRKDKEIDQ
jgi:hypothetical protein